MLKLKKFKEKKLTNKNIMISFAILIGLLSFGYLSKSYAIYKLEKKYDLIQSKIGTFTNGDVKVAVLVDGKETSEFPSYETNYKIESVECTNGVTGSFDVENWQVTITDMSATSTKCTVSFNSKETNEVTPINMSKKEILALNETLTDSFKATLKKELLNDTYPVGSIYMSTTEDTVEKVMEKFGGTWVRYAEGRTLISANEKYAVNTTGGSETHKHISPLATYYYSGAWYIGRTSNFGSVSSTSYSVWGATQSIANENISSSTSRELFYTSESSNLSPYMAVYMYKRTA